MLTQTSIHYSFEQETNTQDDEDEDEITETQEQNKVWRIEIDFFHKRKLSSSKRSQNYWLLIVFLIFEPQKNRLL